MTSEQLLSREFAAGHPIDAAEVLDELPADQRILFLEEIPPILGSQIIQLMNPSLVSGDLGKMRAARAAEILESVPPDSVSVLLRRMEEERRELVLNTLPPELSEGIRVSLRYPENTAGALMDPHVLTLFEDQEAGEAVSQISRDPQHVLCHIPVINRQQSLVGVTTVKDLMSADMTSLLLNLTDRGVARLKAETRREAILSHPGWRLYHDLPVVDHQDRFLGILSYRVLRHLESSEGVQPRGSAFSDASKALGELYWVGISAFVKAASSLDPSDSEQ